ncbi:MAG: hypothetical protein AB2L12_07655 [Smithellaceae bacterium]
MNRGYVRLWRKSLDAGWIKNHKLWAFWSYCLMKASYKEFDAIVGLQVVHLTPGQFVFGRKKAAKETGLTEQEIRTIIAFLRKAGNLTIKTTNKFSVITIVNWPTYQGEETENNHQNNQQLTNKEPHTNIKALKNKKPPLDFSQIQSLEERYSDSNLICQCFEIIASTRKTNRISELAKLNILNQWNKYPADQVMAGIRIYLEKDYAGQGKNEKYLLGIIRGNSKQKPAANIPGGKVMKRTGSFTLDKVYQEQGFTLI